MKAQPIIRKHVRKPLDKLPKWALRLTGIIFVLLAPILMTIEAWANYVADGRADNYKESVETLLFGEVIE